MSIRRRVYRKHFGKGVAWMNPLFITFMKKNKLVGAVVSCIAVLSFTKLRPKPVWSREKSLVSFFFY